MADHGDLQSAFDNGFFQAACQDVLRIVSVLSLDSTHITKPESMKSTAVNFQERLVFFGRFLYMVFIKGFTPTVFELLPFRLWQVLTITIYFYRLIFLPFYLRLTGYAKYTSWNKLGSNQPKEGSDEARTLKAVPLTRVANLAAVDFADPKFQTFVTKLHGFTAHLSPHSQSPGNPFIHNGFPGNFFDHLVGVYKILLVWQQPQYVVRAGLFHSVYGTFDYRYSLYDLRDGRSALRYLVGPGAEELAFAICTSDRIGLLRDLSIAMYGQDGAKQLLGGGPSTEDHRAIAADDHPRLLATLTQDGFAVRNHITQKKHVLPADFFAQFVMVMIADFMEQVKQQPNSVTRNHSI